MSKKYSITAIIYDRRGAVLSLGKNSYHKTHPLQAHYAAVAGEPHKMFLHAEIDAIIQTGWKGINIAEFGEEYGQKTYLIPQDATTPLPNITKEYIYSLLHECKFIPNPLY